MGSRLGEEREGDKGKEKKCSTQKIAYCEGTENPNIKSLDYFAADLSTSRS